MARVIKVVGGSEELGSGSNVCVLLHSNESTYEGVANIAGELGVVLSRTLECMALSARASVSATLISGGPVKKLST